MIALATVSTLALGAVHAASQRRKSVIRYSNLDFLIDAVQPQLQLLWVLYAVVAAGMLLFSSACARPFNHIVAAVPNLTMIICVDTSGSMASRDITPSRAGAVRVALQTILAKFPNTARAVFITFASAAHELQQPDPIKIPAPNGETAIGDALAKANAAISAPPAVVVLLTDGVNNRGRDPFGWTATLAARGIRIFTIGIGTERGDAMPGTSERATLDERTLQEIARCGKGMYFRVSSERDVQYALESIVHSAAFAPRAVDLTAIWAITGGMLVILGMLAAFAYGAFS